MTDQQLTDLDRELLNAVQWDFPLEARPFAAIGERLDVSEPEVRERVAHVKSVGVLRQLSAIFDTRALGYSSALVAAKIAPERIDEAAAVMSAHPGVSHNYKRNHAYNLWYTIAVPPGDSLEDHVDVLHRDSGALITRRVVQEDLPLVERPFAAQGELIGCSEDELLALLASFKERKLMRRFAAVMNHRSAGYKANAMGVWAVPDDRLDEIGPTMAGFARVSHCYRRPVYDDWPYSIFTMVHGMNARECEETIAAIREETGVDEYALLWSVKEYKKTRVRYYTDEWDAWRAAHTASAA